MNLRNMATLNLEVTPVFSLTWLEDHLEIEKKSTEEARLNIIALDRQGRKFTNCTGVNAQFEIKGEGILTAIPTYHSYDEIRSYVLTNRDLMFLKQQFDENPYAITVNEITRKEAMTPERENLILHNNFGVCSQQRVTAIGEGLARARSFFTNQESMTTSKLIESNYAEIAAYDKLQTIKPNHKDFVLDLYSQNQVLPEDQNYNKLYESDVYDIAFGSSLAWVIQGGTNFWKDVADKYQINSDRHLLNVAEGNLDLDMLSIDKLSEQTTLFKYQLYCQKPSDRYKFARPHRYRVRLTQQNMQTRHLLRPAVHTITLDVHCEPPHSQKLYWA